MFDNIDKKIIEILQREGRITMTELGRRVELTTPAVTERVRRLEEHGVIRGFRADVCPATLGKPYMAFLMINAQPQHAGVLAEHLSGLENVLECHKLAGGAYLAKIVFANLNDLEKIVDGIKLYATVEVNIVTSTVVENQVLTIPDHLINKKTRVKTA